MPWQATDPRTARLPGMAAYLHQGYARTARRSTPHVDARPLVARRCREDGRPDALRPDHGAPFATPACCGLSPRSGWWIQLGSRQQRRAPGRPAQQGRHERRPRPRTADATRPPAPHQRAPQARVERCCRESTDERPQEALTSRTPAALSQPSARPLPATRPAPASPGHDLGRRVSTAGTCRVQPRQLLMSATRLQADLAVEETAEGLWSISCDAVVRARLDAREFMLDA
jgi:putative transposase